VPFRSRAVLGTRDKLGARRRLGDVTGMSGRAGGSLIGPTADTGRNRHWTEGCGRDMAKVPTIFPDEVSTGNDQREN